MSGPEEWGSGWGGRRGSGSRGAGAGWALRGRFASGALARGGVPGLGCEASCGSWRSELGVGKGGAGPELESHGWGSFGGEGTSGGSRGLGPAGDRERKNEAEMLQGQGPGASEWTE